MGAKARVLLLAGVLSWMAPAIDYEPSPLDRMIGLADAIVYGRVVRVNDATVTVAALDALGRHFEGDRLQIIRYRTFDGRRCAVQYAPGQTFIWLLTWRREASIVGSRPGWHVFGFEGEGELPADAGHVYLRAGLLAGFPVEERDVHGCRQRVHVTDRSVFWGAAAGYRQCFRWASSKPAGPFRPQRVCSEEVLGQYRARSPLHRYLAAQSLDFK